MKELKQVTIERTHTHTQIYKQLKSFQTTLRQLCRQLSSRYCHSSVSLSCTSNPWSRCMDRPNTIHFSWPLQNFTCHKWSSTIGQLFFVSSGISQNQDASFVTIYLTVVVFRTGNVNVPGHRFQDAGYSYWIKICMMYRG